MKLKVYNKFKTASNFNPKFTGCYRKSVHKKWEEQYMKNIILLGQVLNDLKNKKIDLKIQKNGLS